MKIPKKFNVCGITIDVVYDEKFCNDVEAWGVFSKRNNKLVLTKKYNGDRLSKENIEQTFFHELVHAVLLACHETELNENEKFVTSFSNILHQTFKTAEY